MMNTIGRFTKTVVAGAMIVAAPNTVSAAAGENGLAFLKIGVGTDAVGMGNAYVSQVSDATATYWNPAGLHAVNGTDVLVMHNEFIADLRMEYAAAARSFGRHGLGISFAGLFSDDIIGRDVNGEITGEVGFHDLAFTLGYAFAATEDVTVGVNARYLREFIGNPGATEDHVATGAGFDVGAQYRMGVWQFGVVGQNIGGSVTFNQVETVAQTGAGELIGGTEFDLPTAVQGGVTWSGVEVGDGGRFEVALEGRQVVGRRLLRSGGDALSPRPDRLPQCGLPLGPRYGERVVRAEPTPGSASGRVRVRAVRG